MRRLCCVTARLITAAAVIALVSTGVPISKTIIRVVVSLGILGLAFVSYVEVASAQRVPPSQVVRCNFSVRVGNDTVVIDAKGIIIADRSDEWVVDFTDALDRRGLLDKGITGVQRVNGNQCSYVR